MCVSHRQAINASYRRRTVMHQVVMQITGISLISTHKLDRNMINKIGISQNRQYVETNKILYNKENQSCQDEVDIQK